MHSNKPKQKKENCWLFDRCKARYKTGQCLDECLAFIPKEVYQRLYPEKHKDQPEYRKEKISCPHCYKEIELCLHRTERLEGYGATLKKEKMRRIK